MSCKDTWIAYLPSAPWSYVIWIICSSRLVCGDTFIIINVSCWVWQCGRRLSMWRNQGLHDNPCTVVLNNPPDISRNWSTGGRHGDIFGSSFALVREHVGSFSIIIMLKLTTYIGEHVCSMRCIDDSINFKPRLAPYTYMCAA